MLRGAVGADKFCTRYQACTRAMRYAIQSTSDVWDAILSLPDSAFAKP